MRRGSDEGDSTLRAERDAAARARRGDDSELISAVIARSSRDLRTRSPAQAQSRQPAIDLDQVADRDSPIAVAGHQVAIIRTEAMASHSTGGDFAINLEEGFPDFAVIEYVPPRLNVRGLENSQPARRTRVQAGHRRVDRAAMRHPGQAEQAEPRRVLTKVDGEDFAARIEVEEVSGVGGQWKCLGLLQLACRNFVYMESAYWLPLVDPLPKDDEPGPIRRHIDSPTYQPNSSIS